MSRQYKNGKCSCWSKIDKTLKEHNTQLDISFDFFGKEFLNISTTKIKLNPRDKPKKIIASYCPFCGNKLK